MKKPGAGGGGGVQRMLSRGGEWGREGAGRNAPADVGSLLTEVFLEALSAQELVVDSIH